MIFESPISYLMIILLDISLGAAQHEYDWMKKENKKGQKKTTFLITTGRFCFSLYFPFLFIFVGIETHELSIDEHPLLLQPVYFILIAMKKEERCLIIFLLKKPLP
jgi:hypothetical protein